MAATLNGAEGKHLCLWEKTAHKNPMDQICGRGGPDCSQSRVVAPVESLPGVEQTGFKTQGPQMAAVYVLICLCYMVGFFPLFGTLVLLIK